MYVWHVTLRYVADGHVRIIGTLRFLTLRYVTVRCGWTRTDHWYITVSYVTLCYVRVENRH